MMSDSKTGRSDVVMAKSTLLVIADALGGRDWLISALSQEGYQVDSVPTGEQALEALSGTFFDLMITDLQPPDMAGTSLLKQVKELSPETAVVVLTTAGKIKAGVDAVKLGAYDYLAKPFQPEELILTTRRALEHRKLTEKVRVLEEAERNRDPLEGLIGTSPPLTGVRSTIKQVARLDSTVLISGEIGTGKELVARTLHELSPRREKPLVLVNCSAIPENLQESELFGHVKGAFPGAHLQRRGSLEDAHGGTAFFDEVGDLSLQTQTKLQRFLQNSEATKVGTPIARRLNVRLIAATQQDLEAAVEQNTFREDLFYRLSVVSIHLPPLRERRDDIPPLAQHFLRLTANRMQMPAPPSISPRAMRYLMACPWRGNVRELENILERAVALDRDGIIGMDDLPPAESKSSEDRVLDRARQGSLTLCDLEREYILEVLAEHGGSRKKTAEHLGITTATLWRKLKQYERQG